MKQKYSNIILSIFNILVWLLFWSLAFMQDAIKYTTSLVEIAEDYECLMSSFKALFIITVIINIFIIIQNRENKKIMLWYIAPTVFYIGNVLAFFKFDLPEFLRTILWAIIPAITFIVFLISELRKDKRKKLIVLYVLAIILAISMIFIDTYMSYIWCIIAAIMQIIYSRKIVSDNKIKKVINAISLGILTITFIFIVIKYSVMLFNLHDIDNKTDEFINKIEFSLNNEKINVNDTLIRVSKNNKWGYINQKGEEIIPCEYDGVSPSDSWSGLGERIKYRFCIAKKDNNFYVISKNGNILITNEDIPLPCFTEKVINRLKDEDKSDQENLDKLLVIAEIFIASHLQNEYEDRDLKEDSNNILYPDDYNYNENDNMVYEYSLKNGYKLEVEEIDTDKSYNIIIKRNNEIISNIEDVNLAFEYNMNSIEHEDMIEYVNTTPNSNIKTFSNGDIPFYNLDKKIQGYISISDGNLKNIEGKYQFLDILNNNILIRDYSNLSNIQEYLINNQTNEVLLVANQISLTKNGMIVKKENNKFVFFDNNLREVTEEYAFISDEYLDNKLLICKLNTPSGEYVLCDLYGKKLTIKSYDSIGQYDYSNSDNLDNVYVLDNIYENYYNI